MAVTGLTVGAASSAGSNTAHEASSKVMAHRRLLVALDTYHRVVRPISQAVATGTGWGRQVLRGSHPEPVASSVAEGTVAHHGRGSRQGQEPSARGGACTAAQPRALALLLIRRSITGLKRVGMRAVRSCARHKSLSLGKHLLNVLRPQSSSLGGPGALGMEGRVERVPGATEEACQRAVKRAECSRSISHDYLSQGCPRQEGSIGNRLGGDAEAKPAMAQWGGKIPANRCREWKAQLEHICCGVVDALLHTLYAGGDNIPGQSLYRRVFRKRPQNGNLWYLSTVLQQGSCHIDLELG